MSAYQYNVNGTTLIVAGRPGLWCAFIRTPSGDAPPLVMGCRSRTEALRQATERLERETT